MLRSFFDIDFLFFVFGNFYVQQNRALKEEFEELNIEPLYLPPRSPALMTLDASIWLNLKARQAETEQEFWDDCSDDSEVRFKFSIIKFAISFFHLAFSIFKFLNPNFGFDIIK